jgi:hypothetical protein
MALVNQFKMGISQHIKITDLGELHWLLGIEFKRNRERCSEANVKGDGGRETTDD